MFPSKKDLVIEFKKRPFLLIWKLIWFIPCLSVVALLLLSVAIFHLDFRAAKQAWSQIS